MRKPIYDNNWHGRRVVSAPNGLWLPQEKVMEHGTREDDCWRSLTMACSLDEAKSVAFSHHSRGAQ